MNTEIQISVVKDDSHSTVEILDAIEKAFNHFDEVVRRFTRFNQDSELSNLNRNHGNWTQVTPELFKLTNLILSLASETNGHFDPTVIDFLETYGYDPDYDFSKLDNPELDQLVREITKTRRHWSEIEVDHSNSRIKLAPNQRIDLGGIGKGYAIDLARNALTNFSNILINAGGDIYAKGKNESDQEWQVGLRHKSGEDEFELGTIAASNLALASSGSWARKVKQFHHIIDPISGNPTSNLTTVYVVGDDATLTDGWATALFVGGKELLEKLPEGYSAYLVTSDNKAIQTPDFPLTNS